LHLKKHLADQEIREEEEVGKKNSESLRRCARSRQSSVTSKYENKKDRTQANQMP
jgi:hypothetical protein